MKAGKVSDVHTPCHCGAALCNGICFTFTTTCFSDPYITFRVVVCCLTYRLRNVSVVEKAARENWIFTVVHGDVLKYKLSCNDYFRSGLHTLYT